MMKTNLEISEEALPLIGIVEKKKHYNTLPNLNPDIVKYRYPIAVIFVLVAKFFEAFAANGIRTILALYLRDDLSLSESISTVMLHIFNFFGQFCPIFGAILADNYYGNIRAISIFCILYGIGWIGIVIISLSLPGLPLVFLVSLSLLLISIGNGSIRACITSLGAMQFKVPEQNRSLENYFSLYYFVYYLGIFLSKLIPPYVRANTSCMNKNGCYPAVFGTLGLAFILSWIVFLIGKFFYKKELISDDNVVLKFYGCVKYALVKKFKNRHNNTSQTIDNMYWLHNSNERYPREFVNDVAIFFQVLKLFIPLPIYYALLAQQDSSWTFQAAQMNTTIAGLTIEPDQAKAMGPIFLFMMIPIWQYLMVPLLKKCNISIHPLYSVVIGGICSGFAFICSGLLQIKIENDPLEKINILWQIPQFVLLMMGELFLSIPGLQFAFTQAPLSMKAVLTAAWFLNNAFGNLIVVILTEIRFVQSQSTEYFMYAVMMLICIGIFTSMAYDYMKKCRQNKCFHQNHDELT